MTATTNILGPARNRVDGRAKVTGAAKYSVEFTPPKCAYAWPVESNIAKGKITSLDASEAQSAAGVLAVISHVNAPKPKEPSSPKERNSGHGIRNEERLPFADDEVHYAGQYVALAVAQTIAQARQAAQLVRVSYAPETPLLTMEAAEGHAKQPEKNHDEHVQIKHGDVETALR